MNRKQRRATNKGQRSVQTAAPASPLRALFSQAVRHHQAGQPAEAERLCRQVLAADARHADSLYLLGVMANLAGRHGDGAVLISQAISLRETEPGYHCHLGMALRGQGKLDEAVAAYQRALALKPDYVDALYSLANTLHQAGRLEAAVSAYDRVIDLQPDTVEAHHNLGNALQQQGKLSDAVAAYERTLALEPDHADVQNNLGVAFAAQGRLDRALACYERAVSIHPAHADAHYNRANTLRNLGRLHDALACYRRVLEIVPDHAFTYHNMGVALVPLDLDAAEKHVRRALELSPTHAAALISLAAISSAKGNSEDGLRLIRRSLQLRETEEAKRTFVSCISRVRMANDDSALRGLLTRALEESWGLPEELTSPAIELIKLNAATGGLVASVSTARPHSAPMEVSADRSWLSVLGSDSLVCALLRSTPINDMTMERFLTMARRALLAMASEETGFEEGGSAVRFHGALASQCFINEYLFSYTDEEMTLAGALKKKLDEALDAGTCVSPSLILAVACYFPLVTIRNADRLLRAPWPADVEATLRQQVREPLEEFQMRATIPQLTDIDDEVSVQVRNQYEEHPYPRWIKAPHIPTAKDIEGYFRNSFPLAPIRPCRKRERTEILICGCGTGRQSIVAASRFSGAEVLAIDLSMSSLGYARRKTVELGLGSVTYAQADLLKLGSLGRSFDIIEAAGVLHHLADPWAGWRVLVSMLRPGGFMKIGLYSEVARRHIVELRKAIEQQGYRATPDDIRRFRRDLTNEPGNEKLIRLLSDDFFSVSHCRDLLFHVQEHRLTLAGIEAFLHENDLTFLGFDNLHPTVLSAYRSRFPDDPAATDLGRWQAFENDNPETFVAMYQFSAQKADGSGATSA